MTKYVFFTLFCHGCGHPLLLHTKLPGFFCVFRASAGISRDIQAGAALAFLGARVSASQIVHHHTLLQIPVTDLALKSCASSLHLLMTHVWKLGNQRHLPSAPLVLCSQVCRVGQPVFADSSAFSSGYTNMVNFLGSLTDVYLFPSLFTSFLRSGVRAMPPRAALGAVPMLGCISQIPSVTLNSCQSGSTGYTLDPGSVRSSQTGYGQVDTGTWLFVGLGARGLLYHALFARQLAMAILHKDEQLIEPEVRVWSAKLQKRQGGRH